MQRSSFCLTNNVVQSAVLLQGNQYYPHRLFGKITIYSI